MAHVVLIACASRKQEKGAKARDLYVSALFAKSLAYAEALRPDRTFILSAKHGLVPTDAWLEPYDESLHSKSADQRKAWARDVLVELEKVSNLEKDRFTILAGKKYRTYLVGSLQNVQVPLEGLKIGKQLQRLDELCRIT
jgi:hypothetical protein